MKKQKPVPAFPLFCDFSCPHAGFAPSQAVGACRREQAVYCAFFRSLNNKHSLCLDRKKRRRARPALKSSP